MRLTIFLILLISKAVHAIDACSEHDYCPPQGTIHVMFSPLIKDEYKNLCKDASFIVHFSLHLGQPTNIIVDSGPEKLRSAIINSFKKWRFGATEDVKEAVEKIVLTSDCTLQDREKPW